LIQARVIDVASTDWLFIHN